MKLIACLGSRMRRFSGFGGAILASALWAASAHAGMQNAIPSCYAHSNLGVKPAPYRRLLYVLIDQTVGWTPSLERSVVNTINGLIGPGTKVVVAEFSAFSQGRYLKVVRTGVIESSMTRRERNNVPVSALPAFDSCMRDQALYAKDLFDKVALKIMKASTNSLNESDIMLALKSISMPVRRSRAQQKIVFVATDGLENSSVTSFYRDDTVREINPMVEIRKAEKYHQLGNFGGARVYVLGGALMPPSRAGTRAVRDGYRDPQVLRALKLFWRSYFQKSNAHLVEFGEPALVRRVRWQSRIR